VAYSTRPWWAAASCLLIILIALLLLVRSGSKICRIQEWISASTHSAIYCVSLVVVAHSYTNQLQRLDGQCAALRLTCSLRRTFFVIMKREASSVCFIVWLHLMIPSSLPGIRAGRFFHSCYTSVMNDPSMSNMTVTVVSKKRKCGPKTRSGCQTCK
jgi:hypothetical protein